MDVFIGRLDVYCTYTQTVRADDLLGNKADASLLNIVNSYIHSITGRLGITAPIAERFSPPTRNGQSIQFFKWQHIHENRQFWNTQYPITPYNEPNRGLVK